MMKCGLHLTNSKSISLKKITCLEANLIYSCVAIYHISTNNLIHRYKWNIEKKRQPSALASSSSSSQSDSPSLQLTKENLALRSRNIFQCELQEDLIVSFDGSIDSLDWPYEKPKPDFKAEIGTT